jgi:hypothetical protein
MDTLLQSILSWQFLSLCLVIFAIVKYIVRSPIEYILTRYKQQWLKNKLWNDVLLPVIPLIVGTIFALVAKQYPYPNITSVSGRFVFCCAAALLSGLVYRIFKSILISKVIAEPNIDDEKTIIGQIEKPIDPPKP